ncbi:MAG: sigma-54-dependent Fis family transcriptional regulator [Flavobacteriales bacterium]|nr:sigma-54-dependent Fis family transcriptional regulator [Flavobacteriales bacterium]
MATQRLLVVDDDQDICLLLSRFLEKRGYTVNTAGRKTTALALLKEHRFDLILCDHRLPDADSLEMLGHFREGAPGVPVIVITGYSDVRIAVDLMRKGALDYVVKPLYPDDIALRVEDALSQKGRTEELKKPSTERKVAAASLLPEFVQGKGTFATHLNKHIDLVAPTDLSVLITGETGTGKEYVAKEIHKRSTRSDKPFVALDCGALPADLATSELFGHVKGSFTGALGDKEGCFQQANGGTLFLDEVGNLTYDNQVKLLRVLQERKVRRIGDNKEIAVDVRIIVATNEELTTASADGRFREDLYHRLNEFAIVLLPLRDRTEDILLFAAYFLQQAATRLNRTAAHFSPEVEQRLLNHPWLGNLRELNNVIKRAVLLSTTDVVGMEQMPIEIIGGTAMRTRLSQPEPAAPIGDDLRSVSHEAEKQAILTALERNSFNKSKTADMLNIDRKTLYNKLKMFGIEL